FLGIERVRDREVFGAHGGDDLVRFGLLDARIVGALADEQWLGYGSRGEERRALPQQRTARLRARGTDPPCPGLTKSPPVGGGPGAPPDGRDPRYRRRSRTHRA